MSILRYLTRLAVLVLFIHFISSTQARSYLDPGTGSYMFQLFLMFLVGGLFAIKLYWKKIRLFFASLLAKKTKRR